MEKMLNEFKKEYACQYTLYLDSADAVDSLLKQEDCDKQEMADARVRWQRKRSVMRDKYNILLNFRKNISGKF